MPLSDKVKSVPPTPKKSKGPVWKGPERDGITFSMLSRFLVCRERYRIRTIDGWKTAPEFNHRIEYGQMWHACEEALAHNPTQEKGLGQWPTALLTYAQGLAKTYPLQAEQIDHWYQVCLKQFPRYIAFWAKQPDVLERTPVVQEQTFDIPYLLPSGRTIRLRGKWDAIDMIGERSGPGLYIQENKTKSEIDETGTKRQLTFDLQTMMYMVALSQDTGIEAIEDVKQWDGKKLTVPVAGVRYNVVRRPLSGGKGSIVRHKPSKSNPQGETKQEYYNRLAVYIDEEPETYFARWKVEINEAAVKRFRRECLDPILENLCDWYWEVSGNAAVLPKGYRTPMNWRHPFGVWNALDEGGSTDLDEYLATGSTVGLVRVDELFSELV